MQVNISLSSSKKLSKAQVEYRKFLKGRLKERGKDHPFQGSDDEVADFLAEISEDWAKHKAAEGIETKG